MHLFDRRAYGIQPPIHANNDLIRIYFMGFCYIHFGLPVELIAGAISGKLYGWLQCIKL